MALSGSQLRRWYNKNGAVLTIKEISHLPEFLFPACVAIVYLGLHGIFRIQNVDDAWSLSFAYNFLFKHVSYDLTFGAITGGCGVQYFGKTYAYIYGFILNILGWTKSNALWISTGFLWMAAVVWYFIIRKLTRDQKLAVWFGMLMLILEPFFQAANEARPDALTFFLISVAFLAFLYGRGFEAGLAAMVAVENHPLGVAAFFYILAAVIVAWMERRLDRKIIIHQGIAFIAGLGLGFIFYIYLHRDSLATLLPELTASNGGHKHINNFLVQYFFVNDFARHLPELFLIITAGIIFIRNQYYRDNPYVLVLLIVLPCLTLFIKRPNFRYIVFVYPVFLLLISETFRRIGKWRLAVGIICLLLLPPYTYFFWRHHDYKLNTYLSRIIAVVPRDGLPVVGSANDWFAFKDRDFYALNYNRRLQKLKLTRFYLIENSAYRHSEFPGLRDLINSCYTSKTVAKFRVNHELFRVRLEQAKVKLRS